MEKNSELYLYALELGCIPIEEYEEEEEETK